MFESTNSAYNEANCRRSQHLVIMPRIQPPPPAASAAAVAMASMARSMSAPMPPPLMGLQFQSQQQQHGHQVQASSRRVGPPPQHQHPSARRAPSSAESVSRAWHECRTRTDALLNWVRNRARERQRVIGSSFPVRLPRSRCPDLCLSGGTEDLAAALRLYLETLLEAADCAGAMASNQSRLHSLLWAVRREAHTMSGLATCRAGFGRRTPQDDRDLVNCELMLAGALQNLSSAISDVIFHQD